MKDIQVCKKWLLPKLLNWQGRLTHSHVDGNIGETEKQRGMVAEEGVKYGMI